MNVWQWILSILLFIISFGLLIVIHEFGHFSTAKLFNVYCQEFSIGFGPKLLKVRRKGHETYFSIRAIPLGGYVSMYGEGVELEDGLELPPERSIDGISRPKRALVMSAGILLNAFLALILFAISNICFPQTLVTSTLHVSESSLIEGANTDDKFYPIGPENNYRVYINDSLTYIDEEEGQVTKTFQGAFYILDDDVTYKDNKYVLCWYPNTNASEPKLSESLTLFVADDTDQIKNLEVFKSWEENGVVLANYPNIAKKLSPAENTEVTVSTRLKTPEGEVKTVSYNLTAVESGNSFIWKDLGVSTKLIDEWAPFGDRLKGTFEDFGEASIAVFKGLATLFRGNIQDLSGVVGIFTMSSTVLTNYTFNYYLYFWGLISVNLAIFNLLPFPGLDGWQLLVTCVEGGVNAYKRREHKKANVDTPFVEWKIPSKVKNIVSAIGLILLFVLMFAILGFDIARVIKG